MSVLAWALSAALVAGMVLPAVASAAAPLVNVRIEGEHRTVYAGKVPAGMTPIIDVDGDVHPMSGKALGTIADAARLGSFFYEVKWFGNGGFVDAFDGEKSAVLYPDTAPLRARSVDTTTYLGWQYRVNYTDPGIVGSSDYVVRSGDNVLWYYGPYAWPPMPAAQVGLSTAAAVVGAPVTITATQIDGSGVSSALPTATVRMSSMTATAADDGTYATTFTAGLYRVSAEKEGSVIRSAVRMLKVAYPSTIATFSVLPRNVRRGGRVVARGYIMARDAGLGSRSVLIQMRLPGTSAWRNVAAGRTFSNGAFAIGFYPRLSTHYRALWRGDVLHHGATSPGRLVVVRR